MQTETFWKCQKLNFKHWFLHIILNCDTIWNELNNSNEINGFFFAEIVHCFDFAFHPFYSTHQTGKIDFMNSIPWRLNAGSFVSLNKVSNIACSYFVCGCSFLNATYSCVGMYIVCLQKVCMASKEKNIFSRLVRWFEKLLYDSFFSVPCLSNCASIDAICVSVRAFGCGV